MHICMCVCVCVCVCVLARINAYMYVCVCVCVCGLIDRLIDRNQPFLFFEIVIQPCFCFLVYFMIPD